MRLNERLFLKGLNSSTLWAPLWQRLAFLLKCIINLFELVKKFIFVNVFSGFWRAGCLWKRPREILLSAYCVQVWRRLFLFEEIRVVGQCIYGRGIFFAGGNVCSGAFTGRPHSVSAFPCCRRSLVGRWRHESHGYAVNGGCIDIGMVVGT